MSALDFATHNFFKKACNVVVKQNCYQVLMMQGGNLYLDCLLLWVCFRCLSMNWDRGWSWNERVPITGNCREFNWICLLLLWTSGKTLSYEQTKRKPRLAKTNNVAVFTVYANIFVILLTVTWELFYCKGSVTRSFFNDRWSFFSFLSLKIFEYFSCGCEKLDSRKNMTYSSYLFPLAIK